MIVTISAFKAPDSSLHTLEIEVHKLYTAHCYSHPEFKISKPT